MADIRIWLWYQGFAAYVQLQVAPPEAFGYADPFGRPELRIALAEYLARARGVRATPDNIAVCCGAAEGIKLVAGALAGAGTSALAIEAFGLASARESLVRAGLRCPPLTVDSLGADVIALNDMPDVGGVVQTPSHQFPIGTRLSSERRAAVIDWARRTGGVIIEMITTESFAMTGVLSAHCTESTRDMSYMWAR